MRLVCSTSFGLPPNNAWRSPCVPMRERHECHCMLFLTEDNDFAGEETVSSLVILMLLYESILSTPALHYAYPSLCLSSLQNISFEEVKDKCGGFSD